jgi:cytoskeletal protein CcmA (bactofilin family)
MKQSPQGELPLVIGLGMIVKGRIYSKGDVFVYGEVEGEIDVANCTLTVGPHGKVVANAKARDMEIQGIITGDVETSGTTSIRHTGQLIGDVRTGGIVVEVGAVLKGLVEIVTKSERRSEAANGQ